MKDESKAIIWPVYLDSNKTRSEGRRIAKRLAVKSPKLREISSAAEKLGMNPQVEKYKSYPSSWWESSGRVIVDRNMSKNEIILKISHLIKSSRS